jgi:hypothetical protein
MLADEMLEKDELTTIGGPDLLNTPFHYLLNLYRISEDMNKCITVSNEI